MRRAAGPRLQPHAPGRGLPGFADGWPSGL